LQHLIKEDKSIGLETFVELNMRIPTELTERWANKRFINTGPAKHWITSYLAGVWGYNEHPSNIGFWEDLEPGDAILFYSSQVGSGLIGLGVFSHKYIKDAPLWYDDFKEQSNKYPRSIALLEAFWFGDVNKISVSPPIQHRSKAHLDSDMENLVRRNIGLNEIIAATGARLAIVPSWSRIQNDDAFKYVLDRLRNVDATYIDYRQTIEQEDLSEAINIEIPDNRDIDSQIASVLANFRAGNVPVTPVEKKKRAVRLYQLLKIKFGHCCQACDFSLLRKNGKYYIEACHIKPHANEGNHDYPENILILCPNCHKTLDHGTIDARERLLEIVRVKFPDIAYSSEINQSSSKELQVLV